MRDDDEHVLARYDLTACEPPPLPADFAERVVAELAGSPAGVPAGVPIDAQATSTRSRWKKPVALAAAAAVAATAVVTIGLGVEREAPAPRGAVSADRPLAVELGASSAALDRGAQLQWERHGDRIVASHEHGQVTWNVAADDKLKINTGVMGASVEAAGARLRMEVRMLNGKDKQLIGVAGATAASIALVSVVVYEGFVAVSRPAAPALVVAPGTTYHATIADDPVVDRVLMVNHPPSDLAKDKQTTCRPHIRLPRGTKVLVAGGYRGRSLDYAIDSVSNDGATQVDVHVTVEGPVALLVGAYDPTIWNIHWGKGTVIAGVIATGYHHQAIAGLPRGVPTFVSTHDNGAGCGYFDDANSGTVTAMSAQLLGESPHMRRAIDEGRGVVQLGPPTSKDRMLQSKDTPVDTLFDRSLPRVGKAGLDDAIARGILRPATKADMTRARARLHGGTPDSDGTEEVMEFGLSVSYTVTGPFRYPPGLYGAHMAVFFVAPGVPMPPGDPGHSHVFLLK